MILRIDVALDANVNRSLNSVQARASSDGVHELLTGPRELSKLRESTRMDEARKNGRGGIMFLVI